MDSLSQIVLGAAVGEIVLGKKIGNRAMLWGAVAGTIPDLDVISNLWLDEVDGLAAHRGFSHSVTFSVLGAIGFGHLIHKMYESPHHRTIAIAVRSILFIAVIGGLLYSGFSGDSLLYPSIAALAVAVAGFAFIRRRYYTHPIELPNANKGDWMVFFFWGLFTHPILDCFTVYGTQLFSPFTKWRVAWSTISVADPMYTVPFLICLIIASFYAKESRRRRVINYIGLGLSCGYLLFTIVNKQVVTHIFKTSLAEQGYTYNEMMATPTILNNVLWYGIAKSDDTVIFGKYSYFDSDRDITFYEEPIGEHLIADIKRTREIGTLTWFSDDFYQVIERGDTLQFNDMRYGRFNDEDDNPDNYIFNFKLIRRGPGKVEMLESQGGPPPGNEGEIFSALWKRIMGEE